MSDKYQIVIQPIAEQGIKEAYYWVSNYSPENGWKVYIKQSLVWNRCPVVVLLPLRTIFLK